MTVHIFDQGFVPLCVYFLTSSPRHEQENVKRPLGFSDMSQLLFVLDGSGILTIDEKEYPLKKGCAFYIDQNTPHTYKNISGLVTAWITWRGDGCENIRNYIRNVPYMFSNITDVRRYAIEIERLEQEYYSKKREGMMSWMLYALIMSFFEETMKNEQSEMERVLLYMEKHFDERINVAMLAEISYRSVSTFCKDFKKEFGCTAIEKLTDIRLLNARSMLLANPQETIKSIASKCSFEDVSYFSKAYKKKFFRTPTEERNIK